jgi:hypothetical protein
MPSGWPTSPGRGDLIRIAAPDTSSKRLKRRNTMSFMEASPVEIECILSASDTYIQTLSIKQIDAQPWLTELVIKTQLLTEGEQ